MDKFETDNTAIELINVRELEALKELYWIHGILVSLFKVQYLAVSSRSY